MTGLDIVKQWIAAVETNGDAFAFMTEDAVQEEMPNKLFPAGRVNDLAAMRHNAARGRVLLSSQRYEIVSAIEAEGRIAIEIVWHGVLAGTGAEMTARSAMFLELRGGRIARIRNYDCFAA